MILANPVPLYIYKQKAVCLAGMTVKLYQNVDDELCDVTYIFALKGVIDKKQKFFQEC